MSDRLTVSVHGIVCHGYHGVFAEERAHGQRFVVDLDMVLGDAVSAMSDRLDDTVDYSTVSAGVARIVEGEPVDLIERVAGRIADMVLDDARVVEVTVRVSKPDAQLPVVSSGASVTLRRSR